MQEAGFRHSMLVSLQLNDRLSASEFSCSPWVLSLCYVDQATKLSTRYSKARHLLQGVDMDPEKALGTETEQVTRGSTETIERDERVAFEHPKAGKWRAFSHD
jgi:hypothetical protein